jgi:hypothetical protein
MTYRDEESDLARRRALIAQRPTIDDDDQLQALDDELERIDHARNDALKKRLPMVARARIASPCSESWDAMVGGDAVRTCASCNKEVFDLSSLTLAQAEALLLSRTGQATCARLFVRADGTMLFADCIVGARGIRMRRAMGVGAGVLMAGAAFAMAAAVQPRPEAAHCRTHVQAYAMTGAPDGTLPPEGTTEDLSGYDPVEGEMEMLGEMAYEPPTARMGDFRE